jgi:divalent metal cation (Fe/Co/Zn/Cd) transporter
MKIHPAAPASYIGGLVSLLLALIGYLSGYELFDPVMAIVLYLLLNELSKFIAEYTMKEDDGTNSNS